MEVRVVNHPLAAVAGRVIPLQRQNPDCAETIGTVLQGSREQGNSVSHSVRMH